MPHTCQVGDRVRSVRGLSQGTTDWSFQFDEVGLTADDFNAFEKILGEVTA